MSVTEKPLTYLEYPDDLPDKRYLVPQFDTAAGGMGTQGKIPDSKAVKDAFTALNENITKLGFLVVEGKLCQTFTE